MKQTYNAAKKKLNFFSETGKHYKELRTHLNRQPVGFPRTLTGTELRILKVFFTAEEAKAALNLTYQFQSFETVFLKSRPAGFNDESHFRELLLSMEKKGSIFVKHKDGNIYYALHPFVIGMFEMHLSKLDASFFLDTHKYVLERFLIEYLTTEVPQMRVIPIHESLPVRQNIATYDQVREIIERSKDRIGISNCICRTGRDMAGDPCKVTDRREICMGFRDYADSYARNGWGRSISREEAIEILDQNEKEGLVLFASSMQEPQFVCSCCSCCCGVMEMVSSMPRPVDFAASNFYAVLDTSTCNGCKRCVRRCHMNAITVDEKNDKAVKIDLKRCIGCGVCVPTCKTGSLQLKMKDTPFVPPKDHDDLYETIMRSKRGLVGQLTKISKAVIGMKV